MADFDDVRRIATGLPEVTEQGTQHLSWRVKDKNFVWDRPLRKADLQHLGTAPSGPVVGVMETAVLFTTPHVSGYPAVLGRLDLIDDDLLEELIIGAWLARAPKRLVKAWLADHPEAAEPGTAPEA
jgi:hypothetical protein